MFQFLNTWPCDREMGWSQSVNGVCHDKDNWFFTQHDKSKKAYLWKFPIDHRINSKVNKADVVIDKDNTITVINDAKRIYKHKAGKLHFGDIDHYNGYIFVPVSNDSSIYIYKASDLSFFCKQKITRVDGKSFGTLGWLAINQEGFLYTSDNKVLGTEGDRQSRIHIYKIDLSQSDPLCFHSTAQLFDEYGEVLERGAMQGGCFDNDNHLYISNGYYEGVDTKEIDLHLGIPKVKILTWNDSYADGRGGISVFQTSASPLKGGCENLHRLTHSCQKLSSEFLNMFNPLYKISHPNQKDVSSCFGPEFSHSSLKGEFCFYFDEQYREPEGLTYWNLDKERRAYEVNDKKIGGQLHAITIDMWGSH